MDELIVVRQLPIIEEQLRTLKDRWEQRTLDAETMVCTEETIQAVKAFRADMRREFEEVEALRKQAKQAVMEPYNRFEAVYRECITTAFQKADNACAGKVFEVETDMKRRCEDGLRNYFAELCALHGLDWLTYERAVERGFKVDMASAKAKTPKKLREWLEQFVNAVSKDVDCINISDNAEETMVEYQRTLNISVAALAVRERHRQIEEQKVAHEARKAEREREAEMVRRVEALATPVVVEAPEPEKAYFMDFRAHGTMGQLKAIKQFALDNNIKLEVIKHE